jgi:nitrite reductase (cytochrome c-552)
METPAPRKERRRLVMLFVGTAGVTALVTALIAALLLTIFEHKQEEKTLFFRVVEIDDETYDPAIWAKNFPQQYDSYMRTVDMERTRYGGSEAIPREPDDADPRKFVAYSKLVEDPRLKTMWAGYPFAHDFREERGHAYMLEDQTFTKRHEAAPQPGACLNCHSSSYEAYKNLGNGDIVAGFHKLNAMPYVEARQLVSHPVACIDCHDPSTMQLRITRPAFMEGIKLVKAAEGIENYDVNLMATRQEMRSFVCGQCHVEYYFKGAEKTLTYPWHKGLRGDDILAYFDEVGFKDWTHAQTGAPMLKAQHPEFEMWNQGVHSKAGVSCADCHMPYERVGAMKVSSHHVRSPLLNIASSCQTCHRVPEEELLRRVHAIQDRHYELRNIAMDALMDLVGAIVEAQEAGASPDEMAAACDFQRKATFLLDFAEAENSMGFHAPQEGARILGKSLDYARQGFKSVSEFWRERQATVVAAE